jgi:hypothetical protein
MAFDANIPQPADFLSTSQGQLLANNAALDASFTVDHTAFSDLTSDNGRHKQVTFYQVQADPALTFPASRLYTKNSGLTPNRLTNLFYSFKPETGSDIIKQLAGTLFTAVVYGGTGAGSGFQIVTPWNITIYTGVVSGLSSSIQKSVIFPTPLTNIFVAVATVDDGMQHYVSIQKSNSQILLRASAAVSADWIAIGQT